jgi:hypothetical protein
LYLMDRIEGSFEQQEQGCSAALVGALAWCKAGPSSILGSAPHGDSVH